jgi:DNA polymerase III subunit delta
MTIDTLLNNGAPAPVILLFGEEDYLVEQTAKGLYDRLAAADQTGMNADVLDGDSASIDAILSIARSYPMMADRRVIWVRRFEKVSAKKDRKGNDPLSAYLKSPSQTTVLILTASFDAADGISSSLQRNKAAAEKKIAVMRFPVGALLQKATWVEFPRLKGAQLASWIASEFKTNGCSIEPEAVDLLQMKSDSSLRELSLEIGKVVLYAGGETVITLNHVNDVVGSGRSYTVYDLQRAISKRSIDQAFRILDAIQTGGRQEMLVISALTRFFTALFVLTDAQSMSDRNEMARAAGVPPFALAEHLDALEAYGSAGVERALDVLAEADSTLKSSPMDPTIVLERMLASMLS